MGDERRAIVNRAERKNIRLSQGKKTPNSILQSNPSHAHGERASKTQMRMLTTRRKHVTAMTKAKNSRKGTRARTRTQFQTVQVTTAQEKMKKERNLLRQSNSNQTIPMKKMNLKEMKMNLKEMKINLKEVKMNLKEMKINLKGVKMNLKEMKINLKEVKMNLKEMKINLKEVKMNLKEM